MMKYIEINKTIFDKIVPNETEAMTGSEYLEHARKYHYFINDTNLMIIYNFIGGITQYYIADFNS